MKEETKEKGLTKFKKAMPALAIAFLALTILIWIADRRRRQGKAIMGEKDETVITYGWFLLMFVLIIGSILPSPKN